MLYKGGSDTLCSTKASVFYKNGDDVRLPKIYLVEFEANRSKPVVKTEVIHFKIVVLFFDPLIKVIDESHVIISPS